MTLARTNSIWKLRTRTLELGPRTLIMGVINITPDSFSDGGCFLDPKAAVAHGMNLLDEGADILFARGNSFGAQFDHAARGQFACFKPAGEIEGGQHYARSIRATITAVPQNVASTFMLPLPAADLAQNSVRDQGLLQCLASWLTNCFACNLLRSLNSS